MMYSEVVEFNSLHETHLAAFQSGVHPGTINCPKITLAWKNGRETL